MEVSGEHQALAALPAGKNPRTHWIGGRVGPGTGMGDMKKCKNPLFLSDRMIGDDE